MTKQLILDLWSEWRRANVQLKPILGVPAADTPFGKIAAGLTEAIAISRGEVRPARLHGRAA